MSHGSPGLWVPVNSPPVIAYVPGASVSPGCGVGETPREGRPIGPELACGAGIGVVEGGIVCGVMITGAAEPLGEGDALGTGGGVSEPTGVGEGVGVGGGRIWGAPGAG